MTNEPDFGYEHNKTTLVEDDEGTISVAYYTEGTWWLGWPEDGRVQLDRPPIKLHER